MRPFLSVALLLLCFSGSGGWGCTITSANPDFCIYNGGDEYCAAIHPDLPYCSMGLRDCPGHANPELNGCVAEMPVDECYSPCGTDSAQQRCLNPTLSSNSSGVEDAGGMTTVAAGETTLGQDGTTVGLTTSGIATETTERGATSTGGSDPSYPPCPGGVEDCPAPYDHCYEYMPGYSLCTLGCNTDEGCPDVTSGAITSECSSVSSAYICVIDCMDGLDLCPVGMECVEVMLPAFPIEIYRCLWPV